MKVYNKRDKNIPADAIYVGRPTVFGNPFSHLSNTQAIYKVATRDEAVEKYRQYINQLPWLKQLVVGRLRGKSLVCWCAPAKCHAEILMEIANS